MLAICHRKHPDMGKRCLRDGTWAKLKCHWGGKRIRSFASRGFWRDVVMRYLADGLIGLEVAQAISKYFALFVGMVVSDTTRKRRHAPSSRSACKRRNVIKSRQVADFRLVLTLARLALYLLVALILLANVRGSTSGEEASRFVILMWSDVLTRRNSYDGGTMLWRLRSGEMQRYHLATLGRDRCRDGAPQ